MEWHGDAIDAPTRHRNPNNQADAVLKFYFAIHDFRQTGILRAGEPRRIAGRKGPRRGEFRILGLHLRISHLELRVRPVVCDYALHAFPREFLDEILRVPGHPKRLVQPRQYCLPGIGGSGGGEHQVLFAVEPDILVGGRQQIVHVVEERGHGHAMVAIRKPPRRNIGIQITAKARADLTAVPYTVLWRHELGKVPPDALGGAERPALCPQAVTGFATVHDGHFRWGSIPKPVNGIRLPCATTKGGEQPEGEEGHIGIFRRHRRHDCPATAADDDFHLIESTPTLWIISPVELLVWLGVEADALESRRLGGLGKKAELGGEVLPARVVQPVHGTGRDPGDGEIVGEALEIAALQILDRAIKNIRRPTVPVPHVEACCPAVGIGQGEDDAIKGHGGLHLPPVFTQLARVRHVPSIVQQFRAMRSRRVQGTNGTKHRHSQQKSLVSHFSLSYGYNDYQY